jgi:hypothetical protein
MNAKTSSQPTTKYQYHNMMNNLNHLVNSIKQIPANTVAIPMYLSDCGAYFSTGEEYVYNGRTIFERHNRYFIDGCAYTFTSLNRAKYYVDAITRK